MMPMLGSNPGPALDLARTLMRNAGMPQGRILLVTDGVDRIVDVSMEASPNFPISILGVGSPAPPGIDCRSRSTRRPTRS